MTISFPSALFTQTANHTCFTIPKLSLYFFSFIFLLSKVTGSHVYLNSKPHVFHDSQIELIFFFLSKVTGSHVYLNSKLHMFRDFQIEHIFLSFFYFFVVVKSGWQSRSPSVDCQHFSIL
jgi:hypothetical protein